jgi:predicted DCC family thiol-disulfide oxidoreductase YuxK
MSRSRRRSRELPTLVYDDDCGFCTWCAEFAGRHGEFEIVGFAELAEERKARLPPDWEDCAHLVVDDEVHSCGKAIELSLAWAFPALRPLLGLARKVPGYDRLRERLYRWGADHRSWLGRLASRDDVRSGH